ncbi:MAG: 30S ribosomal protein S9 [Anaerolineae bacterium]|nr:30S ribosomal protein S9 [Anaerolineae bacterium]MDQ7033443.1 30S ribosomal protein S9 [Anaerolineae bacterium]
MSAQYYEGIGRRKHASARVRLFPGGTGKFIVNERPVEEYLPRPNDMEILMIPLVAVGQTTSYDISVHVKGGGVSGQRDAIRLGIARALLKIDPDMRGVLKSLGMLTRDARIKERKKPGLKRARKAPTFTKR